MKIFICCSKAFYDRVPPIKMQLEEYGHIVTLPNSFDRPNAEFEMKSKGSSQHAEWKAQKIKEQNEKIKANDAILVLNFTKNDVPNYLGGATFLEVYMAFALGRAVFFYNPIPHGILRDELLGMRPIVINGDLAEMARHFPK